MNSLTKLFATIHGRLTTGGECRMTNKTLKLKLRKSYPDLMFMRLTNVRWSELALFPDVASCLAGGASTSTETEDSDGEQSTGFTDVSEHALQRQLYHSAMSLKAKVKAAPGMSNKWPPLAEDLGLEAADSMTPSHLFNFVAWLADLSVDVPEASQYVSLSDKDHRKVLSICQDIIYLASRGRKQTPKHLALGLTVRHLTGSMRLAHILSGLGHMLSHESVIEYDSAIAYYRAQSDATVPHGFCHGFTSLVFDNNDFGEETLSGKGTTHCTSGIIVQRHPPIAETSSFSEERESLPRKAHQNSQLVKENKIALFHNHKRHGPTADFLGAQETFDQELNDSIAYSILKLPGVENCATPGWTGFNTVICSNSDIPPKSQIGYLPIIDGSPTRLDVVNEILQRSKTIAGRLEQDAVVVVMDQAIYCKAQHIRWHDEELQKCLVLRLGDFHTAMAFMATIYKRFADADLRDIIIESGVVAEGSMAGILSAHHYNRSIRTIKLMFEGLHHLLLSAYLNSLNALEKQDMEKQMKVLQDAFHSNNAGYFNQAVMHPDFMQLHSKIDEFAKRGAESNPTFALWLSFLEMAKILLAFIRATRKGNWNLHLAAIRKMLPWFFAYDRINYARFCTVYWMEMTQLPLTHPDVHQHLQDGQFVIQRSEHSFSQVAMDQIIEQTLNRDSKTKGGLTGLTLNPTAVHRWIFSFADRASICSQCEDQAGRGASGCNKGKKELESSRIQRDNKDVESFIQTIESQLNPFTTSDDRLVNIYSGSVAPDKMKQDMCDAEAIGEKALENFINERLILKERDLFETIKYHRLQTFSSSAKTTRATKPEVTLRASSQLLARMLVVAKVKEMDMKEVMSYSLCPVPPSLGNYDGTIAKTSKATLMNHLMKQMENETTIVPSGSAWIVDGMALLQQLSRPCQTFGELAQFVLSQLIEMAKIHRTQRIDFVTDRYPAVSIKGAERVRRGDSTALRDGQSLKIFSNNQKMPQNFKKFLSQGKNKEALVEFFFKEWQTVSQETFQNVTVYLAHNHQCHSFSVLKGSVCVNIVKDLECDHEEADTRIFLHAQHSICNGHKNVSLCSSDTDVFIMALDLCQSLQGELYLCMGTQANRKTLQLSKLFMPQEVRNAVVGFHVFTGSDSTSCFKGKGKVKGYELMKMNKEFLNAFSDLGAHWDIGAQTTAILEKFVCHLYGQISTSNLDEARCMIFKTCFRADTSLPPTRDELIQHIKRANYQACIHKSALRQTIAAPDPTIHGWYVENSCLAVKWMDQPLAPEKLLQSINCGCQKAGCGSDRCRCHAKGLHCSELCTCLNCQNYSVSTGDDTAADLEELLITVEADAEEEDL